MLRFFYRDLTIHTHSLVFNLKFNTNTIKGHEFVHLRPSY